MAVYVDKAIFPWRGKLWAHLWADTEDEMHAFARKLGLLRGWFQHPPKASWKHYDVTAAKRDQAIRLGAIACDRYEALYQEYMKEGFIRGMDRIELVRGYDDGDV